MAITVDPLTYIINVPRDDLALVQISPTEIRTMDLNWFRMQLHDLMDDEYGMPLPKMFTHNTEVLLGGITYARIIEILDPYTVTFEDEQYAVNLTGANSNVADKTNVNQVSVRPQNSAGLISSADIEYSSFNGGVSLDEIYGYSGTGQISNGANIGTPRAPSNNLWDAEFIATYRGFNTVYVNGNATIPEYERDGITPFTIIDFSFIGSGKSVTEIFIPEITDMQTCKYYDAHISGTLDGYNTLLNCYIDDLYYIKGYLESCVLSPGVITLGGNDTAHFLDCFSGVPGTGTPTIDFGGSGQALAMRNYNGGILLTNKTGTESASIDLNSGQVKIDLSTVTNGTIVIRGIGKVIESTTGEDLPTGFYGDLYIFNEAMNRDNISSAVWDEPISEHLVAGTTGRSIGLAQFNGYIYVSSTGQSGTEFPIGTEESPVNNMEDATIIAMNNGITSFYFNNDFTISGGTLFGYSFNGKGRKSPTITMDSSNPPKMNACTFEKCNITGVFENTSVIGVKNCSITDITDITLTADDCVFFGTTSLTNNGHTNLYQCFDGVPGVGKPTIDVGACTDFGIWGYRGAIHLTNISTPGTVISYMVDQGRLFVDETDTEGNIIIKGMADIFGTTGGTVIDEEGLMTGTAISKFVWDEPISEHLISGSTGLSIGVGQYDGSVFLSSSGVSGTTFPIGTEGYPVNNIDDALVIATIYGLKIYKFLSDFTISGGSFIENIFKGTGRKIETITMDAIDPPVMTNCRFEDIGITGTFENTSTIEAKSCNITDVIDISLTAQDCVFFGTIDLTNNGHTNFYQCFDGIPGVGKPIINVNTCTDFGIWGYRGAIALYNIETPGTVISYMVDQGRLFVNETCTEGNIIIKGSADIFGEPNGTVIDEEGLITKKSISEAVLDAEITEHQTTDTVGHIFMQMAYSNRVFIDTSSSYSGDRYPIGTQSQPVNNIDDALTISNFYQCSELHLHSDANFDASHDISHLTIKGHTQIPHVNLTNVISNSSTFDSIYITGTISGRAKYYACHLNNVSGISGFVDECQLQGDIYLANVSANETLMHQCSAVDLAGPRIHTGTETLIVTQMSGRMTIYDLVDGIVGLGGDFCQFILDASCTGGMVAIGTKGTIVNNSVGTIIALENTLNSEVIAAEVWNNLTGAQVSTDIEFIKQIEGGRWKIENNQMTFYEDDNITVIATFDLKNSTGAPTETEVYERERV